MKHNESSRKSVVIIGARIDGHAGVVLDTLDNFSEYEVVGFLDSTPELQNKKINGLPVLGSSDDLLSIDIQPDYVHIAIGDNVARHEIFKILKRRGFNVLTLVHPSAIVSKRAKIGEGSFVGPRAVVNNGTYIGTTCIINSGAIVEHDNKIGNSVHMAPGTKTAGRVKIDDFVFVGIGATVLPDLSIGAGAMIGAGATVVKDVPPQKTIIDFETAHKTGRNIYTEIEPDVSTAGQDKVYVAQPTLPDYPLLDSKFRDIANSLQLSNFAKYSNKLEYIIETKLAVAKANTLPNCTTALILAIKAMGITGEVILPSFTFCATGHAVIWNGLTPVFADIDPVTFNIDPDDVEKKITKKTSTIIAVHIFGNPVDIDRLSSLANKYNLKLLFDSAHALGSKYQNKPIGSFGDAECFSLSGTKVVTSAEGGIITSNNEEFMKKISLGRNYGAGSDYDCKYIGLNGKMSEFHAAIAIESLAMLDNIVAKRNEFAALYIKRLDEIPGIHFQHIADGNISTFKDFGIIIDKDTLGIDRDQLILRLAEENIFPKKYFSPPLHLMEAYKDIEHRAENLKHTEYVANNIICLPIYSHMSLDTVEKICYTIHRIQEKQS